MAGVWAAAHCQNLIPGFPCTAVDAHARNGGILTIPQHYDIGKGKCCCPRLHTSTRCLHTFRGLASLCLGKLLMQHGTSFPPWGADSSLVGSAPYSTDACSAPFSPLEKEQVVSPCPSCKLSAPQEPHAPHPFSFASWGVLLFRGLLIFFSVLW